MMYVPDRHGLFVNVQVPFSLTTSRFLCPFDQ
jgi:hypothetical protein